MNEALTKCFMLTFYTRTDKKKRKFVDFSNENEKNEMFRSQKTKRWHPYFGAGFPGEHFFRGYLGALVVIRDTLEQIPLREILLLKEILG
jgi:hypothetical protein